MVLYHKITSKNLEETLSHGLKRSASGKGYGDATVQADDFLDDHRPHNLRQHGVSRNDNLYAFVGDGDSLVDITNGATILLKDYPLNDSHLLRLSIDADACYVSDLDRYDAVKAAVANHETSTLIELADEYWAHVTPLRDFHIGDITRPEVMITQDIKPDKISLVS